MDDTDPGSTDEPRPSLAQVELIDRTQSLSAAQRDLITSYAQRALSELNATGELRVAAVDDEEMAAAHVEHTGIEGTTDVLTFDLSETDSTDRELDVDVLICVDEAHRRAMERGHPVEHELLLYAIHAALHCLGHDDHDHEDASRMHAEEDRLLTLIGIGAVYAAASNTTDSGGDVR